MNPATDQNPPTAGAAAAALAPLRAAWRGLSLRDRRGLQLAAAVLLLFMVWSLAVQPAWHTLASAPTELEALDVQLQTMQGLATEVSELRAAPPVTLQQATEALQAATAKLGDQGKLAIQGERATLTLKGVGTSALSNWLAEARAGARARPVEAFLNHAAQGYSGTLVLSLGGGS